jgi:hypothetical protein
MYMLITDINYMFLIFFNTDFACQVNYWLLLHYAYVIDGGASVGVLQCLTLPCTSNILLWVHSSDNLISLLEILQCVVVNHQ